MILKVELSNSLHNIVAWVLAVEMLSDTEPHYMNSQKAIVIAWVNVTQIYVDI